MRIGATIPPSRWRGAWRRSRDLVGRRKDGSEFPVEIGLNPIKTRRGVLILSVIVDITERKRLERLKDTFVSTVSHELRTPLTSICGSLGLLMGTAAKDLPERTVRLLTLAQSNSERLVKLVNDILDIEKLEAGQVVFKFKLVELRPLIEQVVDGNRGFADTYLVGLRLDIQGEAQVWADPDRLSQVVTNLISNAIKFSRPDGEVVIAAKEQDGGIRLSVRDHGNGIPAEFKPRIFQKFAQADGSNTKKTGGTGLGLSIVKEIVTRLSGDVGFADAPGRRHGILCRSAVRGTAGREPASAAGRANRRAERVRPVHPGIADRRIRAATSVGPPHEPASARGFLARFHDDFWQHVEIGTHEERFAGPVAVMIFVRVELGAPGVTQKAIQATMRSPNSAAGLKPCGSVTSV